MKIFGITFTTKTDLKAKNAELMNELEDMIEMFPFKLGQTVYDVALKNAQGRYTRTKPSFEYSTITAVTVDEKNYFSLVKRYRHNDVFFTEEAATDFLKSICK